MALNWKSLTSLGAKIIVLIIGLNLILIGLGVDFLTQFTVMLTTDIAGIIVGVALTLYALIGLSIAPKLTGQIMQK